MSLPRPFLSALAAGLITACLPAFAFDVNLAWNANEEPDITGYRLYWGTASRTYSEWIDLGKVMSVTLTNLPNHRLFFAVTAWNGAGLESGYSNEVWVGGPVPALPGPHRGGMVTAM